jgi:hypothetical protein
MTDNNQSLQVSSDEVIEIARQQKDVDDAIEQGCFMAGNTSYSIPNFTHRDRLHLANLAQKMGAEPVLGSEPWLELEKELTARFMIEGVTVDKKVGYFDEHPEEYMRFFTFAMKVVQNPFVAGVPIA